MDFDGWQEVLMLSKCANPSCSAPFLYLHEGKLFRIAVAVHPDREASESANSMEKKSSSHGEFFWLCASCCSRMTVVFAQKSEVKVVPLRALGAAS